MKIFHNPDSNLHLTKYGIEIPLTDDRDFRIYDFLRQKKIPVTVLSKTEISITQDDLLRVHDKSFVDRLYGNREQLESCIIEAFELVNEKGEYHRYNPARASAPLAELFESVLKKTQGTVQASLAALESGSAFFLGGGFHHAMSFGGRGFCLINDVVIALRWLQHKQKIKTAWVIDVDAHKGDGTAELTFTDDSIHSLSIHMKKGWPLDGNKFDSEGKLYPWFIPSNVDIEIDVGEELHYLPFLEQGLETLEKLNPHPDLAIVVQGSDPFEEDQLPSASLLKLTQAEMLQRDLLVHQFLRQRNIPVLYVMAGGYGPHVAKIYCQFLQQVCRP